MRSDGPIKVPSEDDILALLEDDSGDIPAPPNDSDETLALSDDEALAPLDDEVLALLDDSGEDEG